MLKNIFILAEGPLPSVLQEVAVPVINNSVCEAMYRNAGYIEHIPHIFICAGWRNGGFDSCEVSSLATLHKSRKLSFVLPLKFFDIQNN